MTRRPVPADAELAWRRPGQRPGSRLDEDDVRVRPGRGTRPRTRTRPAHRDATPGFVIAVDRGRYTVLAEDRQLTAVQARELGRHSVVVGDRVALVGDVTGATDTLARIVRVEPRETVLRRSADDGDPHERIIVANADQLVVVSALADPPPRIGLIDRCLVAAYVGGLDPLLCLTKADLITSGDGADPAAAPGDGADPAAAGADPAGADPAGADPAGTEPAAGADPTGADPAAGTDPAGTEPAAGADPTGADPAAGTDPAGTEPAAGADPTGADPAAAGSAAAGLAEYAELGVPSVTTRRGGDLTLLRERLAGRVSVLVGHSGVGKSTLVNALVPDAGRATGAVSAVGRGRHTSSSAVALPLPGGGWVIDTPGIRSFGLAHVTPADLLAAFPDLAEGAEDCPRNCAHLSAADGCRLDDYVTAGHSTPGRLASFRRLLTARSPTPRE